MTNIDELERLHAAASAGRGDHAQGPWDAGSTYPGTHARGGTVTFVSTSNTRPVAGITVICESQFPADAIAIAATHNALPGLIAELRALREVADAYRLLLEGRMFDTTFWEASDHEENIERHKLLDAALAKVPK